jgi:hypothetical protein
MTEVRQEKCLSTFISNRLRAVPILAWVARASLAGQGFGSPFVSNQPSTIMPPVYPLLWPDSSNYSEFTPPGRSLPFTHSTA